MSTEEKRPLAAGADELLDELYGSVIDGDATHVTALTQQALTAGVPATTLLYDALIPALQEVGQLFEEGRYFVPEMLLGAKAMKAGLALLRPLLAAQGAKPVGAYLILTVKGDIHDIGKDLVKVMIEGAGFQVIDLGVNVTPEQMIEAIRLHQPQIVGFSAFLTTTMPMFKTNIEALKAAGLRDQVKVMVGGAPVTAEYARHVGADAYARDATMATRIALDLIANPHTSQYLLRPDPQGAAKQFAKIAGSQVVMPPRRLPARPAMTPRERVLAVLRHREPDRVPHFEWVHDVGVIKALTNGGSYFDLIEQYDIDGVMVAPEYRKRSLGDDIFIDEWGAVRRIGQDNYAMPVDDQAPLQSLADLGRWSVPDPNADFRYQKIRDAVARFGGQRAIILQMRDVWSGPRDYIGYAQLFINLKECPELVEGVVQRCVDHYIRVIERGRPSVSILSSPAMMWRTAAAHSLTPNSGQVSFSPTTGGWSRRFVTAASTTGNTATATCTPCSTQLSPPVLMALTLSTRWVGCN